MCPISHNNNDNNNNNINKKNNGKSKAVPVTGHGVL
jgi:hypothetical protein